MHKNTSRRVLFTTIVLAGLVVPALPATASSSHPAATHTTARVAAAKAVTSTTHPFSDPGYYPLQVEAALDCVKSNPGCKGPHDNWSMDEIPTNQIRDGVSHAQVYAMGAGILHIKDANGAKCGVTNSFGTEVWVDHGGGVISRYGHLSKIIGKEGDYVAAGQAIGVVGDTGKKSNCGRVFYTDYNVKVHGYSGSGVQIKTLVACGIRGTTLTYPQAGGGQATFNTTPQGTVLAEPPGAGGCLPTAVPATAPKAYGVSIKRPSSGKLTLKWSKPSSNYRISSILVEVSAYHAGSKRWDYQWDELYKSVSASSSSYTATGLTHGTKYRMRVEFHNAVGWSAYGSWFAATA